MSSRAISCISNLFWWEREKLDDNSESKCAMRYIMEWWVNSV